MDDKQKYLLKLQEEFLRKSAVYMIWVQEGRRDSEMEELSQTLRSLISEIKAIQYDLRLKK